MHGRHNFQDKIMNQPIFFLSTNWSTVPSTECAGESGKAFYRTLQLEGLRVRMVEYSKNYKADHWCSTGHIVYCIEGEMISELSDGRSFVMSEGMSYVVSDDMSQHRSYSKDGAKLIIIDGRFLKSVKEQIKNPWRM
jgi:hypothetical protein